MISLSSSPAELKRLLVMVAWVDAHDPQEAWMAEADAVVYGEVEVVITSVGWVISKGTKYLTLGADYDAIDKDYGRVTKIPLGMITSLVILEPVP